MVGGYDIVWICQIEGFYDLQVEGRIL